MLHCGVVSDVASSLVGERRLTGPELLLLMMLMLMLMLLMLLWLVVSLSFLFLLLMLFMLLLVSVSVVLLLMMLVKLLLCRLWGLPRYLRRYIQRSCGSDSLDCCRFRQIKRGFHVRSFPWGGREAAHFILRIRFRVWCLRFEV
jgi:hypothetical protein